MSHSSPSFSAHPPPPPTPNPKRPASSLYIDREYLELTPLGGGSEVGRSCLHLKYKGLSILLDCGCHPGYNGIASLPFFDEIDPKSIDLILISHFHLDHAAALPYFLQKTEFKGEVYMTHPTKSIYKLILQDYVKVSTLSVEESLYDEKDLLDSMEKIKVLNYHQVISYKGIKFWAYNAGHVLGAAMFMIEIAGVHILYTGDYSRREDRHLMSAETPEIRPDVLIIESTYGVQTLPPVKEREKRFTDLVTEIVSSRRGKCLLPVFALGRAQELLLILDEHWEATPQLHGIPIYYASALAKKCMNVYQTYLNMMNKHIQQQAQYHNPFIFKHIFNLKGMEAFEDTGPAVVMASPGMLQNGLARELFELWAPDNNNGVIITGYSVEGTLAKHILTEPSHITSLSGAKIPLNCTVAYISFSAHADFHETAEFVDILKPPHIILVHGEAIEGVGRLRDALKSRYKDTINVIGPRNCQTVQLEFRRHKIAKTVGKLAAAVAFPREGDLQSSSPSSSVSPPTSSPSSAPSVPQSDRSVSGLLVRHNFQYQLIATDELGEFTPLQSTVVTQQLSIPFHLTWDSLKYFVQQMFELDQVVEPPTQQEKGKSKGKGKTDHKQKETDNTGMTDEGPPDTFSAATTPSSPSSEASPSSSPPSPTLTPTSPSTPSFTIHGTVTVQYHPSYVHLSWQSGPVGDMLCDAVVSLLLNIQNNPHAAKIMGQGKAKCNHHTHHVGGAGKDCQYGPHGVAGTPGGIQVEISCGGSNNADNSSSMVSKEESSSSTSSTKKESDGLQELEEDLIRGVFDVSQGVFTMEGQHLQQDPTPASNKKKKGGKKGAKDAATLSPPLSSSSPPSSSSSSFPPALDLLWFLSNQFGHVEYDDVHDHIMIYMDTASSDRENKQTKPFGKTPLESKEDKDKVGSLLRPLPEKLPPRQLLARVDANTLQIVDFLSQDAELKGHLLSTIQRAKAALLPIQMD